MGCCGACGASGAKALLHDSHPCATLLPPEGDREAVRVHSRFSETRGALQALAISGTCSRDHGVRAFVWRDNQRNL